MSKEEIYDEQIQPLIAQVLEICKREKIAMIADFSLDDDGLKCTSALLEDEFNPTPYQLKAFEYLKPRRQALALTETVITREDGSKSISIRMA